MTPSKEAMEEAEKTWKRIRHYWDRDNQFGDPMPFIAAALDEFASEKTYEVSNDLMTHYGSLIKQRMVEARLDALNQAAKLMRSRCRNEACDNKCWHEHEIRALASKEK